MYVRVTPVRFEAARPDPVVQVTREAVLPLLQGLPGFRRYHGALDRAQGSGVAISYWETQEQAQAVSGAVRAIMPQLQAAGIELSPASIYEVVAEG